MSADVAEAYRGLRSTIKYADGDSPLRSVLIVDVDRPTASQVARQLAGAVAHGGDSCAYVETDVRNAGTGNPGFADLILCRATPDEVVTESEITQLFEVSPGSGGTPDVLSSSGLRNALDTLQERFQYLILASAPLPEWNDALALAATCDATILVISAGRTRRARAIEARDALERVGANLLGIVMVERRRRWF